MIIAIDGPSGSGKSTTARKLAERLGYLYLDTGAMYRAIALAFLRSGWEPTPENARKLLARMRLDVMHRNGGMRVFLDGEDVSDRIRTPEVSAMASRVSALEPVRKKMVEAQRRIARDFTAKGGGVVVEGRDIGTVVFPDADVKVFMVADPLERARRRQVELKARGREVDLDTVLAELEQRDRQDAERALAPLRKAEDAIELDTTSLTPDEQVAFIFNKVRERIQASKV
ncbi:(d)CMP kinase [Rhodocaloribacter sp.]